MKITLSSFNRGCSLFSLFLASLLWAQIATAVDCQAYRERFQCAEGERYPLHLSFDDGPALQTVDVLDVLKRENIKATFFVIAEKIECDRIQKEQCNTNESAENCQAYQECLTRRKILARTRDEGHTIGSHAYQHLHYAQQPVEFVRQHFQYSRELLEPFLNTEPPLFRLPYGDGWFNRKDKPAVMQALKDLGFIHINWPLSAFDWNPDNQQGDKILANVMEQMCSRHQGGVVAFHDGVDTEMHQGRLFTTTHLGEWIAPLRCVADFKPLSFFEKTHVMRDMRAYQTE
ncbi:MAG: hypothetical protein CR991_08765 [Proteobacteria bacterium]|nr:MAG: hypothetical protein CR991_08765 [Pseudomonadota bacterium]